MASRRRRQRRRHKTRTGAVFVRLGLVVLGIILVLSLAGVAAGATVMSAWLEDLPDTSDKAAFRYAEATRIYSADGKLLAKLYLENRTPVPISRISTALADAVVAVEDERFYKHKGVDPVGIARAAVTNLEAGSAEEGASTITQQFVRNTVLLDERTDISLKRKIREAYLALQIEKRFSKREILELYLNTIYFGEGAYGAEAAARTYFGKSAAKLNLSESALLAGIPQRPSKLSPYDNMEGAIARREQVLRRMLANGMITQEAFERANKAKVYLRRREDPLQGIYAAPYFVSHVKKWLQQKYPPGVVFKGGLKVYTTIDMREQEYAEQAVRENLGRKGDPAAALVAIDPRNGHVTAMVGGTDFAKNKFNLATQGKRQPGSAFKTFALVAALDEGVAPWTKISSSSPAYIDTKPTPWVVSNSEGRGKGNMSLESATWGSVNTVFARLTWEIGADKVAAMAKKMGITTPLPDYPSITLGTRNVSPLEMASAYGTLAANGIHRDPVVVTKIVDASGKTIYKAKPKARRAVSKEVAGKATEILEGVITHGTARRAYIGRPAAGKTGTSQNYRDAWFVGYTPQRVAAVWVGYPSEKPMLSVHGSRGFGGTLAAPIWADFMRGALKDEKVMRFERFESPKWDYRTYKFPVEKTEEQTATADKKKTDTKPQTTTKPSTTTKPPANKPVTPPPPPPPPPTETTNTGN